MALEIIVNVEHELGANKIGELSSLEDLAVLSGPEKDSGHWSEEYVLDDDTTKPCSCKEIIDDEIATITTPRIPTPPPLPPLLKGTELAILEIALDDSESEEKPSIPLAPSPPPLPKSKTVTAYATTDIKIDDSKCCIVCFDPPEETIDDFNISSYFLYESDPNLIAANKTHINLPCCKRPICKVCMTAIVSTEVGEGRVQVSCPHPDCGKPFTKDYIQSHISKDDELLKKFKQFLVDVENNGLQKTCPNCCHITSHQVPKRFRLREQDVKIDCEVCGHEWCFRCHAPWHKGISCRQFQKGSKEFHKWTKSKVRGVANCQKCPMCRVYIQRSTGCNHMQCNRCNTDFCYDCGNRYLELGIMDHDSTLNIWGCPDNYCSDEPIKRNIVRWGYLSGKMSYLIAYPPLLIGACGLVVVGGAIIVPIYAGYKIHSYLKFRRRNNGRKHQ